MLAKFRPAELRPRAGNNFRRGRMAAMWRQRLDQAFELAFVLRRFINLPCSTYTHGHQDLAIALFREACRVADLGRSSSRDGNPRRQFGNCRR